MGFWFWLIYIAVTLLAHYFQPRPKTDAPQPSSLGDFNLPTAEEGRAIPVAWGTCRIRGPNVTWYGDLVAQAIDRKEKGIVYHYSLGMDYVLCLGPVDALIDVRWDDKPATPYSITTIGDFDRYSFTQLVNWLGTSIFTMIPLFGGDDHEGGIQGNLDFYAGSLTQTANDYLQDQAAVTIPGYRGVCHAVLRRMYLGNSSFLRPISFTVRRCPNQLALTGGHENIAGDANPAAMIYEILTDTRWGLGLSSGLIDVTSFRAAGDTLYTEALGLSMLVDTAAPASEIIQEILRHVDGVLYADPATGALTLKLARADYTVGSLPVFDESNLESFEIARGGWGETRNNIKIEYVDRAQNFTPRVAQAQDLANIQIQGGQLAVESINFRGLSNAAAAQRVAARALKALSLPPAQIAMVANREAWALRPGSVAVVNWPPLGITGLVFRVTRPRSGSLLDGKIQIDAVPDIFAVDWTGYSPPPGTVWTNPTSAPSALSASRLIEAPYGLIGGEHRRAMTLAARGAGVTLGYEVWSDPAGGTAYAHTADASGSTPSGTLNAAMAIGATSLVVLAGVDMWQLASVSSADLAAGKNLLLIDDELIAWQTITDNLDGTYTITVIARGVLDTSPRAHSSAARVWFLTGGSGLTTSADYGADSTVTAKLLPFNSLGTLPIASASQISVGLASRAIRAYVPTAVKLNTVLYPATITGELTVSWSHRNRLTAWTYDNSGATGAKEPGTHYRVKVYGEGGGLVHTEDNLTGTSWTYVSATEISESGLGRLNNQVRVVVETLNDASGLASHQTYDYTVPRV